MKKIYKLEDLDCANCAAKMERAINKIEGVISANVSFMSQKLSIEVEEGQLDSVMEKVVKACKKVEPDCKILL